jgi:hypothetical protein
MGKRVISCEHDGARRWFAFGEDYDLYLCDKCVIFILSHAKRVLEHLEKTRPDVTEAINDLAKNGMVWIDENGHKINR